MSPIWVRIPAWFFSAAVVAGNGLFIYLIITRRNLRTTTNWFVLSLAVADFGVGAVYPPVPRYNYSDSDSFVDNILFSIWTFFLHASVTNLCALTLDRYLAIVKPLRYVTFMTKKRVALLIFASWSVTVPVLIVFFMEASSNQIGTFAFHNLFTVSACVFLLFATVRIFLIARKHARQHAAVVKQLNFNHTLQFKVPESQETAAAKIVYIVVAVIIFWSAVKISITFCDLLGFYPENETLYALCALLTLINSAVNPIAYAIYKRDIRKGLKRLFCNN